MEGSQGQGQDENHGCFVVVWSTRAANRGDLAHPGVGPVGVLALVLPSGESLYEPWSRALTPALTLRRSRPTVTVSPAGRVRLATTPSAVRVPPPGGARVLTTRGTAALAYADAMSRTR